jgi:hypothetical protein
MTNQQIYEDEIKQLKAEREALQREIVTLNNYLTGIKHQVDLALARHSKG